jgi:hypothetical protein
MAKDFLNMAETQTIFEQMRGKTVAQGVH